MWCMRINLLQFSSRAAHRTTEGTMPKEGIIKLTSKIREKDKIPTGSGSSSSDTEILAREGLPELPISGRHVPRGRRPAVAGRDPEGQGLAHQHAVGLPVLPPVAAHRNPRGLSALDAHAHDVPCAGDVGDQEQVEVPETVDREPDTSRFPARHPLTGTMPATYWAILRNMGMARSKCGRGGLHHPPWSLGRAKLGGQKLVAVMRMDGLPGRHHRPAWSASHLSSKHAPQLSPLLKSAVLSAAVFTPLPYPHAPPAHKQKCNRKLTKMKCRRRRHLLKWLTHGAGGVAAAVEGGVGGFPGAAGVDAGDSCGAECEKADGGGYAEKQLHWCRHCPFFLLVFSSLSLSLSTVNFVSEIKSFFREIK
ncbi:son of sevenless homolog 2 [Striga asiatica]|uniref:Son of sevenless homolog 2 n=1 Tax=Striga asiatica TaxID=4170 RepID=A0A5A7P7E1_STRAF|nr:son of sevenless homolog 2 [Striga asiatica]